MTKNIRTVLMPFLIISYIVGLRIAISNHSKLWFSVTYVLLVWSVYYFLSSCALITSSFNECYPSDNQYSINIYVESFIVILSMVFGIYQDKKFQNCLKKFDIIDNTLLKLGTITDYDNLRKKRIWCVLGWIFIVILSMYYSVLFLKHKCDGDIVLMILYSIQQDYCLHINIITDLTNASLLQYTGLKFDEINEHLRNLMKNQKHEIIRENPQICHHQRRFSKPLSNKCITWIIIHLYLELRKISSDINSIFGIQMTIKMACYFIWIIIDLYEFFNIIFIDNYEKSKIMAIILLLFYLSHHIFKFLLVNYTCETVSTKADATVNLLNRLSCTIYDVEIREIISQFLLRIVHAPLRFYGMGLFQFGFKFLYKFITSLATVLVIIIQAQANK